MEPKKIKALLITNPHNPVGRCYTPSVLRKLMAFCHSVGLHYISDEVFGLTDFVEEKLKGEEKGREAEEEGFKSALEFVNDGKESPMDLKRVHVIYSMSKSFGLAGIRMVCGSTALIPSLSSFRKSIGPKRHYLVKLSLTRD